MHIVRESLISQPIAMTYGTLMTFGTLCYVINFAKFGVEVTGLGCGEH